MTGPVLSSEVSAAGLPRVPPLADRVVVVVGEVCACGNVGSAVVRRGDLAVAVDKSRTDRSAVPVLVEMLHQTFRR